MISHRRARYSAVWVFALLIGSLVLVQSCSTTKKTVKPATQPTDRGSIEQQSILETIVPILDDSIEISEDLTIVEDTVFIDSLLAEMSLEEKIGQLFYIPAYGSFKNESDNSYRELLELIERYNIGGLVFFNGDVYGQTVLTNKLQKHSKIPLWITQDMEYGAAMRLTGTTRFTPAMGVAATQNPEYAYWMGNITAREANALGVNQIFAPVLDVNNNPDNPVINVRSFSGNPDTVAQYGNQFVKGVQSEGLVATAKHFPGHGDTGTDSHLALPVIEYDYSRLDTLELVPFRSAVNNGVNSVMSAHIAFPKISRSKLPATMDSRILKRILVDSLQFDGLIVTDGLEMRGISAHYSPGEAVIKSLEAGADLMLLSPDELTAIHEIKTAVSNGTLAESRIDQSVRKLLKWKQAHGLFQHNEVDIDLLSKKINKTEYQLVADEISRKSLTLLNNRKSLLPIRSIEYSKVLAISVADTRNGTTGSGMFSELRKYHPNVTSHVLDKRTATDEKQEILQDAEEADLIIIGSFIYVRSGKEVQFDEEHRNFLQDLIDNKPSVLVAFGNPYVVQDLPDTDVQLMAWAANSRQVKSAIPALFGASKIDGRLPIEIPGMYNMHDGITLPQTTLRYDKPEVAGLSRDSLRKVDHIMQEAIFDSTFPGGVVAVVKDGVIAYEKGFGYETYEKLDPVRSTHIYDLASLTKVTATTPSVMKLVDEEKLSLDDKVSNYIPEFREGEKSTITVKNLLLHNSGLPAFREYVDELTTRDEILAAIKQEPLINPPGQKFVYSDLGFILLGEIVEEISGKRLDEYVRSELYAPLGMHNTFFNPADTGDWLANRIPPTEKDTVYRKKTVHARAHDERAYYMDGVAGHAGLFSTAHDLAIYTQLLLNNGAYGGRSYMKAATVQTFVNRQSKQVNRGLGFDRKGEEFSTAGSLTSNKTFGHTGFTGTSYWIDPEKDLAIIILTNRTYPYRSYGKNISEIRAQIADAVVSSIIN